MPLGTALLPDFVGVGPSVEEPNRGDRQHPDLSSARRTECSFFRRFVDPAFAGEASSWTSPNISSGRACCSDRKEAVIESASVCLTRNRAMVSINAGFCGG
jgi:hypothetical protein